MKKVKTKAENIGKGKVTPIQVAFIVDSYLSDNDFTETRSTFCSEASHILSNLPVKEAPRSLLSLGAMLDEYICLKEQKVFLEQEKLQVQNLLRGMQQVMNGYNASANLLPSALVPASSGPLLQQSSPVGFSSSFDSFNQLTFNFNTNNLPNHSKLTFYVH
ncbi:hypothetical protein EJD97_002926 [Solanum chilense]|uniref:Uncharacterized protein n=1 Tax=Solanum chilense TaxID=4083 RepID=A0A6N2C223_SOLCI|nr:hypothetical protein EJD97_002926 [Solanum chilense]